MMLTQSRPAPVLRELTDVPEQDPGQLVARCLAGSQEAWTVLVERYARLVWTVARSHRLSDSDCEEVFQLTWLRVHQNLARMHTPERFPAWLTTCARRESLRQYERTVRYVPVEDMTTLDRDRDRRTESGPEEALLERESRAEIRAALARLSERDQALLALVSADPAPSYDEVSLRLGIARGSVGPLRGRALRRLAGQLDRERERQAESASARGTHAGWTEPPEGAGQALI
ncbi:sigma-70 family RNA polymerase sigma factor [Streptomyces sp. A1547]|uniref:RNA polymerase sigma factor n=1 Tax=Streptomyces sp. A1547 TaxID=2563105 RepID=UPI001F11866C|nr:sigma-70 family RNA polymerase sigma factor [Streptomyces sp. A1547]